MPRRLKVPTDEKGLLELQTFNEAADGTWEGNWESLRGSYLAQLISRVPRSAFNHVLNGFSAPFVAALGLPPEGALLKMPSPFCEKQANCVYYEKRKCIISSKKLPYCYEPVRLIGALTTRMANEAVFLWKEGVYVVAVYDD